MSAGLVQPTRAHRAVEQEIGLIQDRPVASNRFHWTVALLSCWFVFGAYLDAWAHNNIPQLETFFTPWHGILYSGAALFMGFIIYTQVRNNLRGFSVRRALPEGYGLTLVGLLGFAVGGFADMLWHLAFGIEKSVEAAISPTHLLLILAGLFAITGPLRAGWRRSTSDNPHGFIQWGPIILSLTVTLLWLMTLPQILHPLVNVYAARVESTSANPLSTYVNQVLGAASILISTFILMGLILFGVRRWRLPFGTFTFLFTVYAVGLTAMQAEYRFIPGSILTGLLADILNRTLEPSMERRGMFQLFAFAVPLIFYLLYFLTIALTGGIAWSIHMWLGMSVLAGAISVGLTVLMFPASPGVDSQT